MCDKEETKEAESKRERERERELEEEKRKKEIKNEIVILYRHLGATECIATQTFQ